MNLSIEAKNKQNFPYNINDDNIKVKISIFEDFNNLYASGIDVLIYANFDSIEQLVGTYTTNQYGVIEFIYNTNNIINKTISTGQVWCSFTYNGNTYISNKTRINFVNDGTVEITLIIMDANTVVTRANDPNGYINVNANTSALRLSNPDDYTIFTREFP